MRPVEEIRRQRNAEHALAIAIDRQLDARRELEAAKLEVSAARGNGPRVGIVPASQLRREKSWSPTLHIDLAETRKLESSEDRS